MPPPTPEVRPAVIDLIDGRLAGFLPGGLLRLHQVTRRELAASESVRSLTTPILPSIVFTTGISAQTA